MERSVQNNAGVNAGERDFEQNTQYTPPTRTPPLRV